jgi:hypothetical protein
LDDPERCELRWLVSKGRKAEGGPIDARYKLEETPRAALKNLNQSSTTHTENDRIVFIVNGIWFHL